MARTLAELRSDLRLDLGDLADLWLDEELNRCISRAVSDLSRFLPAEKFYDYTLSFTVTAEAFTSASAHGTYASLAYKPIKYGSEKITDAAGTVTYTRGTDYTMDYANGKVTTISTGSMAVSTAYLATYTRSQVAIDVSGLAGFIRVERLEYPLGSVPQNFAHYDIWGNILYVTGDEESQTELSSNNHAVLYYACEHTQPTEIVASTTIPPFLEDTLLTAASAYALQMYVLKMEHQSATDLTAARTQLTSATTAQTLLTTALANIAKYLNNNTSADAAGLLAQITTDLTSLRTVVVAAIASATTYLGEVKSVDIAAATGAETGVQTYLTGASAPSVKKYLEDGDDTIITVNKGGEGTDVPIAYRQFSAGALDIVRSYHQLRTDSLQAATARTNAALAYIQNAAQALSNLRSYIEQSTGYQNIASIFAREAEARVANINQLITESSRYIDTAGGQLVLADRYKAEATTRMSEVQSIWRDRKEYIGNYVSVHNVQIGDR